MRQAPTIDSSRICNFEREHSGEMATALQGCLHLVLDDDDDAYVEVAKEACLALRIQLWASQALQALLNHGVDDQGMCLPQPPATFERWKAIETTGRALGLTAGSNKKLELQVMDLLSQTVQRAVQWMHDARIAIATLGPHTDVAGKKRLTPRGRIEKMRRLVASSISPQLDAHLFSGLEEQMDAVRGELREENTKRKSSQEGGGPPKKKKKRWKRRRRRRLTRK